MDIYEKIEKLFEYASLEGSDNGDYWIELCHFANFLKRGAMNLELEKEIHKEIDRCLEFIEKNYELTEREVTETYKIKELEWKYG